LGQEISAKKIRAGWRLKKRGTIAGGKGKRPDGKIIPKHHLRTARSPLTTSAFLTERLAATYSHLSKVFSRTAHLTIEKYLIRLKIEHVKELLSYGELTLNQIADQLRYSSGQHLSNQFRQVTGHSVSEFRRLALPARVSLDAL